MAKCQPKRSNVGHGIYLFYLFVIMSDSINGNDRRSEPDGWDTPGGKLKFRIDWLHFT